MPNITTRSYTEEASQFIKDMGFSQKQFRKKFAKNSVIVSYAAIDDDGTPIIIVQKFTDADPKEEKPTECKIVFQGRPKTFPSRKVALEWVHKALENPMYAPEEIQKLKTILMKANDDPKLSVIDDK